MEIPLELKNAIEEEIEKCDMKKMQSLAIDISRRYRDKEKTSMRLIGSREEAIAYSASRMPATYCAIYKVLNDVKNIINMKENASNSIEIKSLLDVGCGTGSGSWATSTLFNLNEICCMENEDNMKNVGMQLMKYGNKSLQNAVWMKKNILLDEITEKADLVLCAYVLNEIENDKRENVLRKLFNATNKFLVIIEPGTPEGFEEIKAIREYFIKEKANILAPCTHNEKCKVKEGDWCSFSVRVSRSKIHKYLKEGDAPFEDEKFAYIVVSKEKYNVTKNRILRHPKIEKGKITLKVCGIDENKEIIITKKDKELYKKSKKLESGDII